MQTHTLKRILSSKAFEAGLLGVILINAITIYLQVGGTCSLWVHVVDYLCTVVFVVEMAFKLAVLGLRGYWRDGWNKLDGFLVLLSLPSLITPFVSVAGADLSVLLTLRLLRAIRFFRVMHFFPKFSTILRGFSKAMKESWAVLASFAVIIVSVALINCSLFQDIAPKYFGTPADAVYSIFRLFTVEGWYDIPDAIAAATSPMVARWVRAYFCLLLIGGGIIGMSFINSVFVDAMVEDNNDGVLAKLDELNKKIDALQEELRARHTDDEGL